MRTEPIDPRHTNTVALLRGPLVLMAVKPDIDAPVPAIGRAALLGAERASVSEWRANAEGGPVTLAPFTALGARPYTAYVSLT
jgi:hypothetical protein